MVALLIALTDSTPSEFRRLILKLLQPLFKKQVLHLHSTFRLLFTDGAHDETKEAQASLDSIHLLTRLIISRRSLETLVRALSVRVFADSPHADSDEGLWTINLVSCFNVRNVYVFVLDNNQGHILENTTTVSKEPTS
jgi:hypothetical protein